MTVPFSEWVQVVPETSSDERMHVLDDTCWCGPTLTQVPKSSHFGYELIHHLPAGDKPNPKVVATMRSAAELLREIAAADPEAHDLALARGYGVGRDEAFYPSPTNPAETELHNQLDRGDER